MRESIYDEINFPWDPYKLLRIPRGSSDETIKEAYKILKSSSSPQELQNIEKAYSRIKSEELRVREEFLRNRPFENLDRIKDLSIEVKRLNNNQWFQLINNQPET